MNGDMDTLTNKKNGIRGAIGRWIAPIPLLALLIGALVSVELEHYFGQALAESVGLSQVPILFGALIALKTPALVPGTLVYVICIYLAPISIVSRVIARPANALASGLMRLPLVFSAVIHLGLLYLVLHIWSDINGFRLLTVKMTMIAIMVTLSLNVINGYMGEFSCSHPGFMALGAYAASVVTLLLFVNDRIFGQALMNSAIGPYVFPLALIIGGVVASLGALVIAIPSFRTRGDYLAIISLAFTFIIKSLIENLEIIGGPRGLSSQPDWANLPTVFCWTVLCIWVINNFVRSTMGKALNAVRDDETAAEAMTVNTRQTKMVAFMFGAFWAGVAGGLLAHVMKFINPASFGLQKLAEVLAMVYFGGLNSVYGSIVGAVSINLLGEALRPLEIFKWIIIPLLLILVMIYRPTGLIAFKDLDVRKVLSPRRNG